jgi:Carboxypeptidase regulatory-like domain/TonB dependent receptor
MQRRGLLFLVGVLWVVTPSFAQMETATVSGTVMDKSGAVIREAQVQITNSETNIALMVSTNKAGVYLAPALKPGRYRIQVTKQGFKQVLVTDVILNVQDVISRNFTLEVGAMSEIVTVSGGVPLINTENATVSTVVDRNFAENLPMNGRSFQSLIQLTPGVVLVPSNPADSGQFSVNGQRAASNYWMVDGVSANVGIGVSSSESPGNGLGGTLGGFSAMGGTNSLVSVDAMQEFRIQTSTYAPEFGRTPGAQVSIVTRSGTNSFHGTVFDYLRNDVFDANNWFNTFTTPALPKAEERQNDFGGTFSGPILRNKTFFFFSYEGLRLRLPATTLSTVPDVSSRQNALQSLQPFLNAYPLPNGADNLATGIAEFNASYSNPASLDAVSLRLDHRVTNKLNVFGRYNYSPSYISERGGSGGIDALNTLETIRNDMQTATVGATLMISPTIGNDIRVNYSRTNAFSRESADGFGGATLLGPLPFPDPFNQNNAFLAFGIFSLQHRVFIEGDLGHDVQRQVNVVDGIYMQKNSHALKFGVDYQRLSPQFLPPGYSQSAFYGTVVNAANGNGFGVTSSNLSSTYLIHNLGAYAQDTWHLLSRLTLTYGLRWEANLAPSTLEGPNFAAVKEFDLSNLAAVSLAKPGTQPYANTYRNVAPRVGIAYQLFPRPEWSTVFRGGFGVFYDLTTSELGNLIGASEYPNGGFAIPNGNFPWSPAQAPPPPVTPPGNGQGILSAFIPHLQSPYTLQWNIALEQGLGSKQTISASYVGAAGRRLLQTVESAGPSANYGFLALVTNAATSDYDAAQIQFERRLSGGLQALASYTFAHSIDTASAGSYQNVSNLLAPGSNSNNRGASDFDIRHAFSAAITYEIPATKSNALSRALLGGWSLQNIIQGRSAPPVDLSDINFFMLNNGVLLNVRPDLISGVPLYLYGRQYPGGKAFNPSAFTDPPSDPNSGNPLRQGDVGRNILRGFGALQWDFAAHRDFSLRESVKLQFRAELFNVLNHPNFGQPSGSFGGGGFGVSSETLNQNLNGSNLGSGAFSPLYQIGGPRSIQFALKLFF